MRIWLFILSTILLSACSHSDRQAVDKLNGKSYAYHYRDIDSTESFALKAYELAVDYDAGRAEALNNLAFVNIVRMRYDDAEKQLNQAVESTDNQIQRLISYVQQMRLCQRRSNNVDKDCGVYFLRTNRMGIGEKQTWDYYNIVREIECTNYDKCLLMGSSVTLFDANLLAF